MRILYYTLFCFWYLLSLLPFWALYLISDLIFFPTFYLIRYRRKVVQKNLIESFPEKSSAELHTIEKRFYHFFCDYLVETIKLFSISKKEMKKHMQFEGIDEAIEQLKKEDKKFAFMFLGHYCNWEFVASLQYWLPDVHCGQIYHHIYNKAFDKLFLRLRGQFGGDSIEMKDTLRRISQLRKQDKPVMIGFISDQAPKWESMHHWTRFLNHDTSFFIGTERIGKKVDAGIFYFQISRVKRGYYKVTVKTITLHPKEFADYDITDMYVKMLEEDIRKDPAYWLWTHKRWKRTKEEWLRRQKLKESDNKQN